MCRHPLSCCIHIPFSSLSFSSLSFIRISLTRSFSLVHVNAWKMYGNFLFFNTLARRTTTTTTTTTTSTAILVTPAGLAFFALSIICLDNFQCYWSTSHLDIQCRLRCICGRSDKKRKANIGFKSVRVLGATNRVYIYVG